MTPTDQKFVRSVLTGTHWPWTIINGLAALLWLVLGLRRLDLGAALASDAGITAWHAISNSSAVASAPNVDLAVAASMQLSEAAFTFFVALIFLLTPLLHVLFYRRLHRIFRELPPAAAV